MLEEVHPPRPGWYEELYASVLNTAMKSYEAEVSGYNLIVRKINENSLKTSFKKIKTQMNST